MAMFLAYYMTSQIRIGSRLPIQHKRTATSTAKIPPIYSHGQVFPENTRKESGLFSTLPEHNPIQAGRINGAAPRSSRSHQTEASTRIIMIASPGWFWHIYYAFRNRGDFEFYAPRFALPPSWPLRRPFLVRCGRATGMGNAVVPA